MCESRYAFFSCWIQVFVCAFCILREYSFDNLHTRLRVPWLDGVYVLDLGRLRLYRIFIILQLLHFHAECVSSSRKSLTLCASLRRYHRIHSTHSLPSVEEHIFRCVEATHSLVQSREAGTRETPPGTARALAPLYFMLVVYTYIYIVSFPAPEWQSPREAVLSWLWQSPHEAVLSWLW